ncbi:MAG: DPP IV N-terminal domain-containing protein [Nitrolancea sp.]
MTIAKHRFVKISLIFLSALLLLAALAACGTPDPVLTQNAQAGDKPHGKILFAQNGDIYQWDGNIKQITHVGDASFPTWSSDGNRFAFIRTGDAFSDLYSYDISTNEMAQLTKNQPQGQEGTKNYVDNAVWALDPNWSPTGDTIAYVSDLQTAKDFLWIMTGLGTAPRQVTASTVNGDNVENPSFSPDGTQIVFTQRTTMENDTQRTTGLWVVDLNTGKLTSLVTADSGAFDGVWSPDGKWIAFIQRDGTANDLWVVPAAGGPPTQLTQGKMLASPVWSPDGSQIAFFEEDGNTFKVSYVTFNVDGSGTPSASSVSKLFSDGDIDAASSMSWLP